MPFCTACGQTVSPTDTFCALCGARQAAAASAAVPPSANDPFAKVNDQTASVLCYIPIVGWVAAIVVLASQRFRNNRTIRFHAFQGLYLFVAWLIVDWVVSPMFVMGQHTWGMPGAIGKLLHLVIFVAWIFMLVKTSQGQFYRLPIVGELADRSVAEQR